MSPLTRIGFRVSRVKRALFYPKAVAKGQKKVELEKEEVRDLDDSLDL